MSVAVQRHVSMVLETLLFSDKDADVPVLCTTGAYGSRRLENVWRCRRCSSAWLGRLVTMQRLFGVDGDGAVEGFFAVFLRLFSASSSELRPRVANSCSEFVDINTLFERPRRTNNNNNQQQQPTTTTTNNNNQQQQQTTTTTTTTNNNQQQPTTTRLDRFALPFFV